MCNLPPMICSDLDGTLLPYGQSAVSGQALTLIRRLQARGVLFCPASGRQYTSLRRLFAPVAEGCVFLCENGAVVYKDGAVIAKTPMPRDLALAIARDMWQGSEGRGEVMLSGENTSYLMERGLGMLRRIREIGNRYRLTSRRRSSRSASTCRTARPPTRTGSCPAGGRPTPRWPAPTGSTPPWPTRAWGCRRSAGCWGWTPGR